MAADDGVVFPQHPADNVHDRRGLVCDPSKRKGRGSQGQPVRLHDGHVVVLNVPAVFCSHHYILSVYHAAIGCRSSAVSHRIESVSGTHSRDRSGRSGRFFRAARVISRCKFPLLLLTSVQVMQYPILFLSRIFSGFAWGPYCIAYAGINNHAGCIASRAF